MIGKLTLRASALLLAVMFATMAWLQKDDQDSVLWIACYGLTAAIALCVVFGAAVRIPLILLAVGCTVWSLSLAESVGVWLANHPIDFIVEESSTELDYMERSRECLGLAIVVVGTLWLLIVDAVSRR